MFVMIYKRKHLKNVTKSRSETETRVASTTFWHKKPACVLIRSFLEALLSPYI